ncbi:MAG: glycosyltransferase family 2 protein [Candidatus Doudnabacteria bacterium]
MQNKIKLSVIIPSYNTCALTLECLSKVFAAFLKMPPEAIVIDNNSEDNSIAEIKKDFPQVRLIINEKNLGFAAAVNQGIKIARGEYLLLLNTDAFVHQNLNKIITFLDRHSDVGITSPRLTLQNGSINANFGNYPSLATEFLDLTLLYKILPWGRVVMPNLWTRKKFYQTRRVKWLSGTCLFIRRSVLEKIGLFDENYFMYLEDIDFCKRAREAGFQIIFWGEDEVIHHHHGSSRGSLAPWLYLRNSLLYFWKKHYPNQKIRFLFVNILSYLKLIMKKATLKIK